MQFMNHNTISFVPDGTNLINALDRTTALCIAAHQYDTELLAYDAIEECYNDQQKWFTSVVVADGGESLRSRAYEGSTDEEIKKIKGIEQNSASIVGRYSVQIQLGYTNAQVQRPENNLLDQDIINIILACKPETIYTHNLADKHDTHVAMTLRVIDVLRELPIEMRPKRLYGMEVWRGRDWLGIDDDKKAFDALNHEILAASILGLYDSQIIGGKRYDLATLRRSRENATRLEEHQTNTLCSAIYGIDLTELQLDKSITPKEFILKRIDNLQKDIVQRLERLSKPNVL